MIDDRLTAAQHQALAVLVAARPQHGKPDRRPVRASNRTTTDLECREMLTVQTRVAYGLVERGLVRVTNNVLETLELTDAGRALAREAGL